MNRSNTTLKKTALVLAVILFFEAIFPPAAMALTSGPSQPEFNSFQQAGVNDMVDLFTGNFSYNIPLMDVGGYPLNLAYQSDPQMDEEASWVGLGWSLNPGSINRQMRGLPDDFKNEDIKKEFSVADDVTVGVSGNVNFEIFGIQGGERKGRGSRRAKRRLNRKKKKLNLSIGMSRGLVYNSRTGFQMRLGASFVPSIELQKSNAQINAGLGLGFSPGSGLDISPKIGLSYEISKELRGSNDVSLGYNSRRGLSSLVYDYNVRTSIKNDKANDERKKEIYNSNALDLGYNLSFGPFDYIPTNPIPIKNTSFTFNGTVGAEVVGIHPNYRLTGFFSKHKVAYNTETQKAFGSMYLGNDQVTDKSILDYNSEVNGRISEKIPNLPISYGTPDLFNISGQGVGGQFSTVRNDVGIFRPAQYENRSVSGELGIEFGAGLILHSGFDAEVAKSTATKGKWEDNKMENNHLSFTQNHEDYEAYSLMESGFSPIPTGIYGEVGGTDPARVNNYRSGSALVLGNKFQVQGSSPTSYNDTPVNGQVANTERPIRTKTIKHLTAEEAAKVGLDKKIKDYPENQLIYEDCNESSIIEIERTGTGNKRANHHISELEVTQSDGARYVYGLPVYNNLQREVSFSIDKNNLITGATNTLTDDQYGLVSYNAGIDNAIQNDKGKEKYFDATEIPPYAHSYLLTALLSDDYQDKTGDGITEDDLGNAIKFNYSLVNDGYKWRIPIQENLAKYHEGMLSTFEDDKASYLYGEKELWYVHSIESRTMVAMFYTSNRADGLGVDDENGQANISQRVKQLDSIRLFSKSELKVNGQDAVPLKTVHFDYDYSSCKNVPNQVNLGDGKLTLKKVWFTYGNSQRGKLNAYHFDYKNTSLTANPAFDFDYNVGHTDRWGQYKKNPSDYPLNHQYPYVLNGTKAGDTQEFAGAWNLDAITLPSGGKIQVDYESDDYGYVQNKRASEMLPIIGFTDNPTASLSSSLYNSSNLNLKKYLAVQLPQTVNDVEEALRKYIPTDEKLYFNCLISLDGKTENQERVKGYLDFDKNTGLQLKNSTTLLIPVQYLNDKGTQIHPMTFATLQTMRFQRPELVYPGFNTDGPAEALIKGVAGLINELGNVFKGFGKNSMKKGWGKDVVISGNQSWIRLWDGDFKKLGGGSRVKKLTISDEWNIAQGGGASTYGQNYYYTKALDLAGENIQISSGVAAYEPGIGGEENSFRLPKGYSEDNVLGPKSELYQEEPVGESLFPAPVVGYSQVKIVDIASDVSAVARSKTGYTIHEFYTAKDFPTIVEKTRINPAKSKSNPILKFLKIRSKDGLSMSQGVTVEVNDMHGKPKKQSIYNQFDGLVTSTAYKYKTEDETASIKKLDNMVAVIQANGDITQENMGLQMDVWQEALQEKSKTVAAGASVNLDVIIFGIPFPGVYPIYRSETTEMKLSTTTKLVKRMGILEQVEVVKDGSKLITENILYDRLTGNVVLNKTQNEFNDAMYSFNYPAYWAYENMGLAYENIGSTFKNLTIVGGAFPGTFSAENFFNPGDELMIIPPSGTPEAEKYYVTKADTELNIMDKDGNLLDRPGEALTLKVIQSGKKNLLSQSIGQVASINNPISSNAIVFNNNTEVLGASALEFSDYWQIDCGFTQDSCGNTTLNLGQINPYVEGLLGRWRPEKSHIFYGDRTPTTLPMGSARIQKEGDITNFNPFWIDNGSNWIKGAGSEWTLSSKVESFDAKGNQLENTDALGIASSAQFGYNQTMAVAVANNAKYKEIYFDGFEDYVFDNQCGVAYQYQRNLPLYDTALVSSNYALAENISHSGRFSIRFGPGQQAYNLVNIGNSCPPGQSSPTLDTVCYNTPDGKVFETICCSCLPNLNPDDNKEYYLSAWVATDATLAHGGTVDNGRISVAFDNGGLPYSFEPKGPIIEGWQRIEGRFMVAENASTMVINLLNNGAEDVYFDDFRFHPAKSNMQSYVYDPYSLRLTATLDENNYASFYEYDDEGLLIRTKKETERGIVTIQEGRTVLKSNNLNP